MVGIKGKYIRTLQRDEKTGETIFLLRTNNQNFKAEGVIDRFKSDENIEFEGVIEEGTYKISEIKRSLGEDPIAFIIDEFEDVPEDTVRSIFEGKENSIFEYCRSASPKRVARDYPEEQRISIQRMIQKLKNIAERDDLCRLFIKYQFPLAEAEKIYSHHITVEQFIKNPYQFLYAGGFNTADKIAKEEGDINPYDEKRIFAMICHILYISRNSGSTYVEWNELERGIEYTRKNSEFPDTVIPSSFLFSCIKRKSDIIKIVVVENTIRVYMKSIWKEERKIETHIRRIEASKAELCKNIDIEEIEKKTGFKLNSGQRNALELLKTDGIKIITGPPGSGKTALIKAIIQVFTDTFPEKNIYLAATTGTAAQVMRKACGKEASTVHRMLNIRPHNKDNQGKNEKNPINGHLIIVDEISMMDTYVFSRLLPAVRSGTLLLIVGDIDQLECVGYGNILSDLINNTDIETYRLTEVMRQSGTIPYNANVVKHGRTDFVLDDTFHLKRFNSDEELIEELIKNTDPQATMIMSPVKKGLSGTIEINKVIQKSASKGEKYYFTYGAYNFHHGDKVILTRNNYDDNYINGDIGILTNYEDGVLTIQCSDKVINLRHSCFHDLHLAYCITIHKSQGSEKDDVHIILPQSAPNMLTRKLLYTAITRAKKRVYIYSVGNALEMCVRNNKRSFRRTSLFDKKLSNFYANPSRSA